MDFSTVRLTMGGSRRRVSILLAIASLAMVGCRVELPPRDPGPCVRDGDCPSGKMCIQTQGCVDIHECNNNIDCPLSMTCADGDCRHTQLCDNVSSFCPAGYLCDGTVCRYARCVQHDECAPDQRCDTGLGLCKSAECSRHSDCSNTSLCADGSCLPVIPCVLDSDCPSEAYCHSSSSCRIRIPCSVHDECPSDEFCESTVGLCFEGVRCQDHMYRPQPELCNGIDDDCDSQVDEDFTLLGNQCSGGVGSCAFSGNYVCRADSQDVECSQMEPAPMPELCNGLDDDCDGQIDEDFVHLDEACTVGLGECASVGLNRCSLSGLSLECTVTPLPAQPETCDGLDNDCDGFADEDFPDLGLPCFEGIGACAVEGARICTAAGTGTICPVTSRPDLATPEVCNDVDDDCNGQVDESLTRSCSTLCGSGTEYCIGGSWDYCSARIPATEACDHEDNDCDGEVDEGCPASWSLP